MTRFSPSKLSPVAAMALIGCSAGTFEKPDAPGLEVVTSVEDGPANATPIETITGNTIVVPAGQFDTALLSSLPSPDIINDIEVSLTQIQDSSNPDSCTFISLANSQGIFVELSGTSSLLPAEYSTRFDDESPHSHGNLLGSTMQAFGALGEFDGGPAEDSGWQLNVFNACNDGEVFISWALHINEDTGAGPNADFFPPSFAAEGEPTPFDPSPSTGNLVTYEFDCENDGVYDQTSTVATLFECTYPDQGLYSATLQVTDGTGATDTETHEFEVFNLPPQVAGPPSGSFPEGTDFELSVSATDVPDDVISFSWNVEGTTLAGNPVTVPGRPDDGSIFVTVDVTDEDGGFATESASIEIFNVPPSIDVFDIPVDAVEGSSPTLTVSASDVPGDPVSYAWDLDGDGVFDDGDEASVLFPAGNGPGSVHVFVRATDDDGGVSTASATIELRNADPVVDPAGLNVTGNENSRVTLSVAASDFDPLTYEWDFDNDGTFDRTTTVASLFHTYPDDGDFTVRVRVSDPDGGATEVTGLAEIANRPPGLEGISTPRGIDEGVPGNFTAHAFDVPADTVDAEWDVDGDGTPEFSGLDTTYAFPDDGDFSGIVRVFDEDGGEVVREFSVAVRNVDPTVVTATISVTGVEGEPTGFSVDATDVAGDIPLTFEWDFDGDGTIDLAGPESAVDFSYPDDGFQSITIVVKDGDGGQVTLRGDADIANADPIIDVFDIPSTISEGASADLEAHATDVPGDTLEYAWDLDGDGDFDDAVGPNPNLEFGDGPSTLTISVRVTEEDGGRAEHSGVVFIENADPVITDQDLSPAGAEGGTLAFSVSASDRDALTYEWDFDGDGTFDATTTVGSATFLYEDDGVYPVRVRVSDADGGEAFAAGSASVDNLPPLFENIDVPTTAVEGSLVNVNAFATDVPRDTVTYQWDFDNDGATDATGPNAAFVPQDNGFATVTIRATDEDGGVATATLTIDVGNAPPTVQTTTLTQTTDEGASLTLEVTASDPSPVDTLTYEWDFDNDGVIDRTTTDPVTSFPFPDNGDFTVQVRVTDDDGGVTPTAGVVTVHNVAPVIDDVLFENPSLANRDIDFTALFTDVPADTHTFVWDFDGDGTADETTSTPTTRYRYLTPGPRTIQLTVRDDDGDEHSVLREIDIEDDAPRINDFVFDLASIEGSSIRFEANAEDPDGPLTFAFDFGDGSPIVSGLDPIANHVYADDGVFTVTLRVTDDTGAEATASGTITVENAPPEPSATQDAPATVGAPMTFTGGVTDPGIEDTHTFLWDFGDGTTSEETSPSHTFDSAGGFTVTLTVTDDEGARETTTIEVFVDADAAACDAVLSEVMSNPQGDPSLDQWIEIANPSSDPVDLAGMRLIASGGEVEIRESIVIPPDGIALLCRDLTRGLSCDGTFDLDLEPDEALALVAGGVTVSAGAWSSALGHSASVVCLTCDDLGETGPFEDLEDEAYGPQGFGTPGEPQDDLDLDGFSACDEDCDDLDPERNPDADELCDDIDNDCDGDVDEDLDADGDGVRDCDDICPDGDDFADEDLDGTPDACDDCPLDGPPPEDDLDGDGVCNSDDLCDGDDFADDDADGVPDDCDVCPAGPDGVDTDGDGQPNACDPCPDDNPDDADGNGACDSFDCPGGDITQDADGDGICDAVDVCPDDNPNDPDGDGICTSEDICLSGDDAVDQDDDGIPDACDDCPLDADDAEPDADDDGVCNSDDICPDGDDTLDSDEDGVPDDCDACPDDIEDDRDEDGLCDSEDPCPDDPDNLCDNESDTDTDADTDTDTDADADTDSDVDADVDADTDADTDTDDDEDKEGRAICGCVTPSGTSSGWMLGGLLAVLAARRR